MTQQALVKWAACAKHAKVPCKVVAMLIWKEDENVQNSYVWIWFVIMAESDLQDRNPRRAASREREREREIYIDIDMYRYLYLYRDRSIDIYI